jgi:hypothetical protein
MDVRCIWCDERLYFCRMPMISGMNPNCLRSRISKHWNSLNVNICFDSMLGIVGMGSQTLHPLTVTSLYSKVVILTVLYGCEMWNNLSKKDLCNLQIFQHFVVKHIQVMHRRTRSMLGSIWHSFCRNINFLSSTTTVNLGKSNIVSHISDRVLLCMTCICFTTKCWKICKLHKSFLDKLFHISHPHSTVGITTLEYKLVTVNGWRVWEPFNDWYFL